MISKKKAALLNLEKYLEQSVVVRLLGGREVHGTLKGFDSNMNLVLDATSEAVRDPTNFTQPLRVTSEEGVVTHAVRDLGAVVCKGASVMVVIPKVGMIEIENPFLVEED